MYKQELSITSWTHLESRMSFMNFYTENWDFVAEIFYIQHAQEVIKITRLHTANLINNRFFDSDKFWNTWKKYPWLWTTCLARFIWELSSKEDVDTLTLMSVPWAMIFYRKAANQLLVSGHIKSWKQWRRLVSIHKAPLWLLQNLWNPSDSIFTLNLN